MLLLRWCIPHLIAPRRADKIAIIDDTLAALGYR